MYLVVLVTAKDKTEAEKISQALLNKKLAACVNVIEGVDSCFWWKGKIDRADEVLLVIKTKKELFSKVEAAVKALHSYEVPEIIAFDISAGSADYLTWINESCSNKEEE